MTLQYIDILGLTSGTPKLSDVYPAVDVTDSMQSPNGTTKSYQLALLLNFFLDQVGAATLPPSTAATTGNLVSTYYNGPGNNGINATLTDASGTFAPFVIDGVTGVVNNAAYLVWQQTNPIQNGIYYLIQNGNGISIPWVLIRVPYFNQPFQLVVGETTAVLSGAIYGGHLFQLETPNANIGFAPIEFTELFGGNALFPILTGGYSAIFNLTGDTNVTFPTSGTLATTTSSLPPWVDVTAASQAMQASTNYIADNNSATVQFTLPITGCVQGDIMEVDGNGSMGWKINQNAGQSINYGILSTTVGTGGSLASTNRYNAVRLLCVVTNTTFNVLSSQGDLTVV